MAEQINAPEPQEPETPTPAPQTPAPQTPAPQTPAPQTPAPQERSSADIEAENKALRAILSGHVEGINIDEELEFVGPTGKYRPNQAAPAPAPAPVPDQRQSRRAGLETPRAEGAETIDTAALDKEFDNYMLDAYGFKLDDGTPKGA